MSSIPSLFTGFDMNAEDKKLITLIYPDFLTAVQKFLFVLDVFAPAMILVASVRCTRDVLFAGDTNAASTHLERFMRLLYQSKNKQDLVK